MPDIKQYIDLVSVELIGSEYGVEQEAVIRKAFEEEPYAIIVRGKHSIAAGVGLSHDVIVFMSGAIASGTLYDVFKYLTASILKAFISFDKADVPLTKVILKTQDCDFVISSNCNAGINSKFVDYNQLLRHMGDFAKRESNSNSPISRIEAPCDLRSTEQGWICECDGIGNYSLWKVEYKCGEKWPNALYDAVNKSYVVLAGNEEICFPKDSFYDHGAIS